MEADVWAAFLHVTVGRIKLGKCTPPELSAVLQTALKEHAPSAPLEFDIGELLCALCSNFSRYKVLCNLAKKELLSGY